MPGLGVCSTSLGLAAASATAVGIVGRGWVIASPRCRYAAKSLPSCLTVGYRRAGSLASVLSRICSK